MMMMMMVSPPTLFLLSAVLLVSTGTAWYTEHSSYNDAACEDLNSTMIYSGIFEAQTSGGVLDISFVAFGACTNLTGASNQYSSSMFDCTDNEATVSYYAGDSCSGDAVSSEQRTSNTCSDKQTSLCMEDSDWDILTEWVMDVTWYSDADCSTATGESRLYNETEIFEMLGSGACGSQIPSSSSFSPSSSSSPASFVSASSSSSMVASLGNAALRCVNGQVGFVMYNGSDTTCSGDVVMASSGGSGCTTSGFDEGAYMTATCSASGDVSSASSLLATGRGGCYGWSIAAAAAAAAALAAVFS